MKRYHKEDPVSYTLGMTLTFELLKARPEKVRRIYVHPKVTINAAYDKLMQISRDLNIETVTSTKAFNILSQKENCFVIGEFEKYTSLLSEKESHVVLVNPSNSGNLGTIIRSCRGFGIRNMAIIRPSVDHYDPKTVRATMGAVFGVNIQYFDSFEAYSAAYAQHNYYPFMLNADSALHATCFQEPFALVFGNEATGLPDSFNTIGHRVIIRHTDQIDSLNLPVAASIALYEATKGWH